MDHGTVGWAATLVVAGALLLAAASKVNALRTYSGRFELRAKLPVTGRRAAVALALALSATETAVAAALMAGGTNAPAVAAIALMVVYTAYGLTADAESCACFGGRFTFGGGRRALAIRNATLIAAAALSRLDSRAGSVPDDADATIGGLAAATLVLAVATALDAAIRQGRALERQRLNPSIQPRR